MPLFEVCVIHEETKNKKEELILWPEWIMAKDEKAAALQFILSLDKGDKKVLDPKRVKVLVRPF
jgi:hypothetical protein